MTADSSAGGGSGSFQAFRLKAETPVYEFPDTSSDVEEVLPAGTLVTVYERAGDFLHVVTPSDNFGYIAAATVVERFDPSTPPDTEKAPLERRVRAADNEPTPLERILAAGAPAVAGASGAALMGAAEPGDIQALAAVPTERVLIWDRIAANKRGSIVLIVLFVLFVAAFFTAVGVVVAWWGGVSADQDIGLVVRIGIAGAIIALALGIMLYYMAPAAVLTISGAHEVTKAEEQALYRVVENLSIGSGLPLPKVWVIEDSAPNAFATGRDPKNAHVAATRGLLDKLEKRELEAVMAHEMSHVGNYDIRIMTIVAVAVGLIALVSDLLLRFTWYGAGSRSSNRDKGGGAIGLIILAAAIVTIVVSPIVASLIRLALSRQREYLADSSGALLCRNPDALADALEKISADPEPLEVANKATAHLYIANPLKGHESFLNSLFSTHPPVTERIRILRAMA